MQRDVNIKQVELNEYLPCIEKLYNKIYVNELNIVKNSYKNDLYNEHSIHLIIEDNSECVGYVRIIKPVVSLPAFEIARPNISIFIEQCVEISRLIILHDYRQMLGPFLRYALHVILENNYNKIIVDSFFNGANKTNDIFESIGFVRISEVYDDPRFIDRQCVLLYLDLDNPAVTNAENLKLKKHIIREYTKIYKMHNALQGVRK